MTWLRGGVMRAIVVAALATAGALVLLVLSLLVPESPANAQDRAPQRAQAQTPLAGEPAPASSTSTVVAAAPMPKAWIAVDADTGAVIDAGNERAPLPPASTIKLFTALVAAQRLPAGCTTVISARAESMPARKINVKAGQTWRCDDLFKVMMLASANDAAVAMAELVGGGSLDGWVEVAQATAARLGLEDDPLLVDPAGLDDEFSNLGGSRVSARDLAIIARAALAEPAVMDVLAMPNYYFETGGDGLPHKVTNHNRLLSSYTGATGMKTGGTSLAGRTFVASATRGGRTMIAVVLDGVDIYGAAAYLLDRGFAVPVRAQAGLEHLPGVVPRASLASPPSTVVPLRAEPASARASARGVARTGLAIDFDSPITAGTVFVLGLLPLTVIARTRRRRAHRARRRAASAP